MFFIPNEINHFPTFSQQPNRKKEKNQNLNFVKEIPKNSHSKSSDGARGKIKEEEEEEENKKEINQGVDGDGGGDGRWRVIGGNEKGGGERKLSC